MKRILIVAPKDNSHGGNGWYGSDKPHLATEEWGKEMLQTMADYIADFVAELDKIYPPHPAE